MAAQRKYVQDQMQSAAPSRVEAGTPRPRLADDGDLGGMNPALSAQRRQLEHFLAAEDPQVERYNGAMRLAIIVGGSGVWWAMAATGAWRLIAAL